jgi:carbamoyl-phosphate synthase (ammonia)
VSNKTIRTFGKGNPIKILAVDCGIKLNMVRMLVERGAEVKVVPWNHDLASERDWYDGLFISNGPGDPIKCQPLVEQLKTAISSPDGKDKPIFGICLGNQLTGLAAGCASYKLPFGNRGQNQPVVNLITKDAFITPQVCYSPAVTSGCSAVDGCLNRFCGVCRITVSLLIRHECLMIGSPSL